MTQALVPHAFTLRQLLARPRPADIESAVDRELPLLLQRLRPGARVAVAVGSRGIANLARIVGRVTDRLRAAGARPFIIPAMGSHGGATPEGQTRILADYGITPETIRAPIEASMETRPLGSIASGADVVLSRAALDADGILLLNRVKPHTDFHGRLGSGVVKIMVVGLGKHAGAARFHRAAQVLGYEEALRQTARVILEAAPILGGLALVEDAFHQTSRIVAHPPEALIAREEALLREARDLMPGLPFEDIDLLIVDQIGKNISGTGMDSNVIGRSVHGYSTLFADLAGSSPRIKRVFVRGLTPETHGNAIGIGMADFTTQSLIDATDRRITDVNSLTSMTPHAAKLPIAFPTDREALDAALESLALEDRHAARILRIQDTLTLERMVASDAFLTEAREREDLVVESESEPLRFDPSGALPPL